MVAIECSCFVPACTDGLHCEGRSSAVCLAVLKIEKGGAALCSCLPAQAGRATGQAPLCDQSRLLSVYEWP